MCMWAICFLPLLALPAADGKLTVNVLLVSAAIVIIAGLAVVGAVARLCRNVGKVEGAARGFLCGLTPSLAVLAWVLLAQPGWAAIGPVLFAFVYAIPGSLGGTFAGIICAGQNNKILT